MVFNNSKVFPARLLGNKETGGKAEALLLRKLKSGQWEALLGTRHPKVGLKLSFNKGLTAKVIGTPTAKTWLLQFNFSGPAFYEILDKIGQVPTPPYIDVKNQLFHSHSLAKSDKKIRNQYQTIYAKKLGSAAAPTAGLHFTNRLLKKIRDRGVQTEFVTLHVGLGTFDPVNTENIEEYKIHQEWVSVDKQTIKRLIKAKQVGKRIIAVGTTSVRTLETLFSTSPICDIRDSRQSHINSCHSYYTDIFIHPGYKFKFINAIITNFHLPKSSLIMLVSAFIGRKKTLELYNKCIKLKYRFFSFGDAMFLQ